jgi:hypothetical protein
LLAAAFAVAVVAVGPIDTASAQSAGAAPDQAPPAAVPAHDSGVGEAAGPMSGGGGVMHHGSMMMRHMMMHRMMGHMMRADPQQRCIDRLAWRAARRAYVEAKLDLTAAQRPLWDKIQGAAQAEEQKERQLCRELKPGGAPTLLDRLDRMQQFLSARLQGIEAAKPALQSLYQALSPEQRAIIDHPFRS